MFNSKFSSLIPVCGSAVALFLSATSAEALTLNSSSGTWGPTNGGSNIQYVTVGSEKQVRWGDPATQNGQSGLGFTGVGPLAFNVNQIFQVGTLSHFNQPIWSGSAASVGLSIGLDFLEAGLQNFGFSLNIDETPNALPCAYSGATVCPDKISLANAFPEEGFIVGGVQYTLELLGFSNTAGSPLVSDFISEEGGTSTTYLYAQVTEVPVEDVPEPMGLLGLLATAAVGIGRRLCLQSK
jgi:hypothetical protein